MNNSFNRLLIEKVALNVKKYRKQKKFTQATLARKASVSSSTLATFEAKANDITITKLYAISQGLGVSMRDLVNFDGLSV